MNLDFKPVQAEDIIKMSEFAGLRGNKTCEIVVLDRFEWRE